MAQKEKGELEVDRYFQLAAYYEAEYGPQTILLYQLGSFFEMYVKKQADGTTTGSRVDDVMKICELNPGQKGEHLIMAGFGPLQLERYIRKLQAANYTTVIYTQTTLPDGTFERNHAQTVSPGTYFGTDTDILSNYVASIWIHHQPANKLQKTAQLVIAVAAVDVFTGQSRMAQYVTSLGHTPAEYDAFDRLISSIKPSEALVVFNWDADKVRDILHMVGLASEQACKLHMLDLNASQPSILAKKAINAEKQVYQRNLLTKYFPSHTTYVEQLLYIPEGYVAVQALCLLLDFVHTHNPGLVDKIDKPVLETDDRKLVLANHSLLQLNMMDDGRPLIQQQGRLRSVGTMLNQCVTAMGKRLFMQQLQQPVTVVDELNHAYALTADLLVSQLWEPMRQHLQTIKDLERFVRKLVMRKLCPKDLALFYTDVTRLQSLWQVLQHTPELMAISPNIKTVLDALQVKLDTTLDIALCANAVDLDYTETEVTCFFKPGVSSELDEALRNFDRQDRDLQAIRDYFCEVLVAAGEVTKKQVATAVKIHEPVKSQPMLVLTARRAKMLQTLLQGKGQVAMTPSEFRLDISQLSFRPRDNSKDYVIAGPQIDQLTRNKHSFKETFQQILRKVFTEFLSTFAGDCLEMIKEVLRWVRELDLLQCRAYLAQRYNLCRPMIQPNANGTTASYVRFEGIRHPLIEQLQTKELYVTNDLALCEEGLLLYGTNAVGKTSFIKSVGIAVVMAQAGLYVPCRTFEYWPYRYLFTRILGNDNLFKGLSTFAVEMSELRTILLKADANSLVLGDELCSGTESDSALSIFTAGLEVLHERRATFLFATHFHEVVHFDELKVLDRLRFMHMTVRYDQQHRALVYDRKLQDGPGESMYGLEVCKALDLPAEFLDRAHDIRMKYNPRKRSLLAETSSRYNSKKLMSMCEICQQGRATETHHLQHQQHSRSDNAYLIDGDAHKNHVANLLAICENCHTQLHQTGLQHRVAKTVEGRYVIVPV